MCVCVCCVHLHAHIDLKGYLKIYMLEYTPDNVIILKLPQKLDPLIKNKIYFK